MYGIKQAQLIEINYYQVLNVGSNATVEEIKKAYRKLALQYHPDVSGDDLAASAKFQLVKTAYDVLSNSKARQAYHYKHFYTNYKSPPIISANGIAMKAEELAKFAAVLDPYRLDYEGLFNQIYQLINANNLEMLLQSKDKPLIKSVILNLTNCAQLLPFDKLFTVHQTLLSLADKDVEMIDYTNKKSVLKRRLHYWDEYKFLLALAITLVLCVVFFFLV